MSAAAARPCIGPRPMAGTGSWRRMMGRITCGPERSGRRESSDFAFHPVPTQMLGPVQGLVRA